MELEEVLAEEQEARGPRLGWESLPAAATCFQGSSLRAKSHAWLGKASIPVELIPALVWDQEMRLRLFLPDLGELTEPTPPSGCQHQHLLGEDKPPSGGTRAGCWDQLHRVCTRTGFPKLHISSKSSKQERFKHRGETTAEFTKQHSEKSLLGEVTPIQTAQKPCGFPENQKQSSFCGYLCPEAPTDLQTPA